MGLVNLADGQGIKVSGDFVRATSSSSASRFDNGETADMDVPVVAADDEYTDLDNGTGVPAPAATPSASESAE